MKSSVTRIAILLALIFTACSGSPNPELEIQDPWVRAAARMNVPGEGIQGQEAVEMSVGQMESANSAAFMIIQNKGNLPDRLVAVESDVAENVEIHLSEMEEDVMTMHPVEGVDIPAHGQVELKPGGYHAMLIGINQDLKEGDKVRITLVFEKSGNLTVDAEVRLP